MQQLTVAQRNFGLSGLSFEEYDDFLGFGKRAKQRRKDRRAHKKEKKRLRVERKQLKNDQRRAETEALRAETIVSQQLLSDISTPTAPVRSASSPVNAQQPQQASVQPPPIVYDQAPDNDSPANKKDLLSGNTPFYLAGGIAIVGLALFALK